MSKILNSIIESTNTYDYYDKDFEEETKEIIGNNILRYDMKIISSNLKKTKNITDFIKNEYEKKNENNKKTEEFKWYFIIMGAFAYFFNFISVYEIIGILDSIYILLKQDILNHYTTTKKVTFKDAVINTSFREIPELEIEMLSSIIGELVLESLGLEISYAIFFTANCSLLIIILFFPFQNEDNLDSKFSIFEFIMLAIIFLLLYISVGASSLFIYQKFMSYISYFKYKIYFITLFIAIASMWVKNYLNYLIIKKHHFILQHILIYIVCFAISFILQLLIDYYRNDESFGLDFKCNDFKICCINFEAICYYLKCSCCCCKKNKYNISVLKKKKKYMIFAVTFVIKKNGKKQKLININLMMNLSF